MYKLKVKEYRVEKKWSQKQLATRSGVSQSAISYIEHSERNPSIDTIAKLGIALGISPHDLIVFHDYGK